MYRGLIKMTKISLELILSQVISEMTARALASAQSDLVLRIAMSKNSDTQSIESRVLLRVYNNIVSDIRANLYNSR